MVECPGCGLEFEPDQSECLECIDMASVPLTVTDGASAILRKYLPAFGLHERLALESAITECLISKLGVSSGKLP